MKGKIIKIFIVISGGFLMMILGMNQQMQTNEERITTVKMILWKPYCSQEEFDHVLEKINERLSAQLQLQLQVSLIPSGNEDLIKYLMDNPDADIIYTGDFQKAFEENLLMPLDHLLEVYGQDILDVFSEEQLLYSRKDGKQYGLPRNIETASADGIVMRTDLLEKYKINSDDIKTWEDVENVLENIIINESEIYGIIPSPPVQLISIKESIGMVVEGAKGLKVVNYFETEDFREWAQRIYDWGQKGYLYQFDDYAYSSGTTRYLLYQLMEEGYLFSYMVGYKPGIADQESKNSGRELTKIQMSHQVTMNSSYQSVWGIYSGSTHPEQAMKILNFLYKDKEINNLFCWGIEGEHYQKNEEGMLILPEKKAQSDYCFNRNWLLPNGYIADSWEGDIPNLLEEVKTFNQEAVYAPDFGFWFDDSQVQVELERCVEIVNTYLEGFICGKFDPDEMIPMMNSELEVCGIYNVIEEKQRQLKEWEAEQNSIIE